ncbi:RAQPRD family integrative conjugative element protein [Xenorhabdus bovienii]|uniref:integrative conjugative element protein, RAQPRD family n=1 Tax=Xenorhabdus bovienii TaxID=40576 RepID=UPI0023B2E41E|nr:RAQPRD family integrative conjugative element protein [Xenorhabdus bovienii]MDE9557702.1 RAQPRD family integrative conjugative element protein [Xenorhabdus bovienii]
MHGDFFLFRSACLLSLILVCVPIAQAAEKDELASAKNLIDQVQMALERANLAEKQADTPTPPRYDFDYLRIKADLNTIKAGIDHYLTPSRAQQQASGRLSDHYRQEHPQ